MTGFTLVTPVARTAKPDPQTPASTQTQASTLIRSNIAGPAMQTQRFSLSYDAVFDVKTPLRSAVTVWIPFPSEDDVQSVENYWIGGNLPPEKLLSVAVKRESEYGNRYVEAKVLNPSPGDKLSLQYSIVRREYSNPPVGVPMTTALILPPSQRFLQPDRLVPLSGPVSELAQETLAGIDAKSSTGRDAAVSAIYRKTVSMMSYDKSGEGWGRGDVLWACDNKRGNCTDFHSVIIGMARASGIPAKFEIGVSIPNDKAEGSISGYHCWAYLYHPQRGWIPLDASEGWKNDRRFVEYYLGRIGTDRIAFSTGRDLKLGQRGEPLNYFINPYAETVSNTTASVETVPVKLELSFKKVAFP